MSDRRLRELERRFLESGAVEDEMRWIVERVRVGNLSRQRMVLAAYAGHQAATQALSQFGLTIEAPSDLRSWAKTVALEVGGWRTSAWLLVAGLHEALRGWSILALPSSAGSALSSIGSFVGLVQNAADCGVWGAIPETAPLIEGLISQHAARELIWDGPAQGFVAHLALRTYEILTLDRWGHTGEIVDRCAQAVTRFRGRERPEELAEIRSKLMEAMKRFLVLRAFETSGSLSHKHYPMPVIPMFIEKDGKVEIADAETVAKVKKLRLA